VQNKQGENAGGNVASECAAILEYCVLPQILKDISSLDDPNALSVKAHQVAEAIHVQPCEVTWPAWISKDNASTFCHGWLRLMNPRVPTEATKANLLPALIQLRNKCSPHPESSGAAFIWDGWTSAADYDSLSKWYTQYILKHQGTHEADRGLLDALTRDQGLLHFHQAMPLGPKMPECHSMIEHAIGTVKGHVKKELDINHDAPQLTGALWYQTKLQEAIATKLSGDAGKNHVRGSVQKWKFCVQVVAADTDCKIHVTYPKNQFSNRGRGRPLSRNPELANQAMVDEHVSGTAGAYPPAWLC
jgi:hypothetical protein